MKLNTARPLNTNRKLTDIRVTRKAVMELKHGESHGWAVSYADMLMVLLSFFVLFFSLSDNPVKATSELQRIAMSIRGDTKKQGAIGGKEGDNSGGLIGTGQSPDMNSSAMNALAAKLNIDGMHVMKTNEGLIIDLEKSAFGTADYNINASLKQQIDSFYEKIAPEKDYIRLTIIGHTDKRPLRYRNPLLKDNFDLSSLRALSVLRYVLSKGFAPQRASARAASFFDRDARSVSFEIEMVSKLNSEKQQSEGNG